MEILEFVCIMTAILVSAALVFVKMSTTSAIKMQEFAEKQRISAERSKAAKMRYAQEEQNEIAPWANELLGTLGVSPEVIFQDEIPPELAKFMPIIKGFLQNGGMAKIQTALGGMAQPQNDLLDPKTFI